MATETLKAAEPPPGKVELVPKYIDPESIVSPAGNPVYTPPMLADLLPSVQKYGFLNPIWVCPSPELPGEKRLCLEGNRRLAVARLLGIPIWAFDLGRFVDEAGWIELMFHHHQTRRVMTREEIAERAARYMELKGVTAAEAAKYLNVSGPTLSRAFGERRIPPDLRLQAEKLGMTVRSVIAATPLLLMAQALEFALAPGPGDRLPTRDQVSLFIQQLKQNDGKRSRKVRAVTLRLGARVVTIAVGERDSAASVADDLKAIAAKLGKHAEVPPDGWPFLFQ